MMRIFFKLFFLFFSIHSLFAQEEIIRFHSDIEVMKDRSIRVEETIQVRAEGINIKRGIFRDIPTVMFDDNNDRIKVDLDFEQVLMNGQPVNWKVERISDGRRLLIGDADIFLDPGNYTYSITYEMGEQVRLFDNYDELYWNVTGNKWMFPIRVASMNLRLPDGAEIIQHSGYSGGYGESGCDCEGELNNDGSLTYEMNGSLQPYEGLTVAAGWNKGVVNPPSESELRARKMRKYIPLMIMVMGLLLTFLYYFWAWNKVGKDPEKGAIIPRFEPPPGFSPAAARYVLKMGFDNKAFAASIVSMAVKGFLNIDKSGNNYVLTKTSHDESILSAGETKIAHKIFGSRQSLEIKQKHHSIISGAIQKLRSQLKTDFRKLHFAKNKGWLAPGIILSVLTLIGTLVFLVDQQDQFTTLILCSFFSVFIIPVGMGIYKMFKSGSIIKKISVMIVPVTILFFTIFFINILIQNGVIGIEYISETLPYIILFLALVCMNLLFNYLIQAPTILGREKMDEIEGLKMYMEVAEKHRLDKLNPPKETPQLFEALLPFAIALGVENAWSERFSSIIEKAIASGEYRPTWYTGPHTFGHLGRVSRDLGSDFSSSISSASVSPQSSSSSGSSGGGFSGGGGGGGGGGGW